MCAIDLSNQLIPSSTFAIQLDFTLQFGLIKDDKNNQYHLGPNLEYELPQVSYTSSNVPTKTIYPWLGDHYLGIKPQDLIGTTELFDVTIRGSSSGLFVHLPQRVQWRFMNLNTTFNCLVGPPKQTLMIFSDMVESIVVGAQKHLLLRKVQLERTGQGRATVEPFHHERIKLRSNRLEVIEVEIATPDGPLSILPPGKTIVTLGFRRV